MEAISGLLCFIPFMLLGVCCTIFWIWMLVECLTKESSSENDKLIWAIVILALNGPGALLYFFIRRPLRIRELGK